MTATALITGDAQGPVLACTQGLSFWGGVDPATARVIDAHHPLHGADLAGRIVLMPTSRGSCSGSGVLLDMALNHRAPAALIFCEPEDVLTLGALVAAGMFQKSLPVLRVSTQDFARLAAQPHLRITPAAIHGDGLTLPLQPQPEVLDLTAADRAMLDGRDGPAVAQAMRILTAMAAQQGARQLTDIRRGHIDGCIYASPANLTFAEAMADLGGKVRVPTTMNAISVDHAHWRAQGVAPDYGQAAQRLADAYVRMGCQPSFTCAPYLLDALPQAGEPIAWAESNAVIYANSVLGARTPKHPDFLDLCMALTGRAPLAGVYLEDARRARRILEFDLPEDADDALWPLVGYLAGLAAPDCIPLLRGLGRPSAENLRAVCAAFGTTSAAPMLHVEGVTPEAHLLAPDADHRRIRRADLAAGWATLNQGPDAVDLIAIGSPHASVPECRALAQALMGQRAQIPVIVTAGRSIIADLRAEGTLAALTACGVQVIPDLCWCSISEPVFPPAARTVMTNSGKYAHYGPGLSGRALRFGGMQACVRAALTGTAPGLPPWLQER